MTAESAPVLEVAVIGCGIVGVQVALGLLKRNINVTLYEQARELKEIGVGLGIMPPASHCMQELDPRIWDIVTKIGLRMDDFLNFMDGSTQEDLRLRSQDHMYDMKVSLPDLHIRTLPRAKLLSELIKLLPPGVLRLGCRLEGLDQNNISNGRVQMTFADGEQVTVDAVIGCDGLKSQVRRLVLDPDHPAATAKYAHESAYRCMIDMDKAAPVLGNLSRVFRYWHGHGAHLVTYPVAEYKHFNVAAFVRDDGDWPDESQQVIAGSRQDMAASFRGFGPTIRALVDVLPEKQSRWGMFDMLDHPPPSFGYGCVALAGDAAHAMTPHHGYGASLGVEDALVLAIVLDRAQTILADQGSSSTHRQRVLGAAFKAYDSVRRERAQWVVASSRRQGQLAKWEIPEIGNDTAKSEKDTADRVAKILRYDWKQMVADAVTAVDAAL